jgi:opacity protein-like surface antigen
VIADVGVTVGVTVLVGVGVGVAYGDGSTNIKYSSLPTLIYSSFPAIIGSINT